MVSKLKFISNLFLSNFAKNDTIFSKNIQSFFGIVNIPHWGNNCCPLLAPPPSKISERSRGKKKKQIETGKKKEKKKKIEMKKKEENEKGK